MIGFKAVVGSVVKVQALTAFKPNPFIPHTVPVLHEVTCELIIILQLLLLPLFILSLTPCGTNF